jgi:hypothetical protein
MTNQTLDQGLDSTENRALETKGNKLFRNIRIAACSIMLPLIAATNACSNKQLEKVVDKTFYQGSYVSIWVSRDASYVEIQKDTPHTESELFYLEGPAIKELDDLSAMKLHLRKYVEYPITRVGFIEVPNLAARKPYDDPSHVVKAEKMKAKELEAQKIIAGNRAEIKAYPGK